MPSAIPLTTGDARGREPAAERARDLQPVRPTRGARRRSPPPRAPPRRSSRRAGSRSPATCRTAGGVRRGRAAQSGSRPPWRQTAPRRAAAIAARGSVGVEAPRAPPRPRRCVPAHQRRDQVIVAEREQPARAAGARGRRLDAPGESARAATSGAGSRRTRQARHARPPARVGLVAVAAARAPRTCSRLDARRGRARSAIVRATRSDAVVAARAQRAAVVGVRSSARLGVGPQVERACAASARSICALHADAGAREPAA